MSKYRFVKIDGKWIGEHRHVMETTLGRKLLANEHVHHVNGEKDDNRPENLQLVSPHTHRAIHFMDKVRRNFFNAKVEKRRVLPVPLLTLHEAAQMVHRSVSTLRKWSRQGKIKSITISERGDRRYRKMDIDEFLANQNHE